MTEAIKKKRRPAAETRRLLIAAAREELQVAGADVEVANIAKRAGMSEGLVYYHFTNRAGLLNAVVRDHFDRLDAGFAAVAFDGVRWTDRERARVTAIINLMYDDPVAPVIQNVVRTDPALMQEEQIRQKRIYAMGARNIAQAQRDGEIDPAVDPAILVAMLLAGVEAGISQALLQDPVPDREAVFDEVWAFLVRAAGVRG